MEGRHRKGARRARERREWEGEWEGEGEREGAGGGSEREGGKGREGRGGRGERGDPVPGAFSRARPPRWQVQLLLLSFAEIKASPLWVCGVCERERVSE